MKVFALSAGVVSLFGLAACGGGEPQGTGTDTLPPDSSYTSPAAPPTETVPPPATVTPDGSAVAPDGTVTPAPTPGGATTTP